MLSRIDIKVKLNAMPKAKYFQKAAADRQVRLAPSICWAGRRARSTAGTWSRTSSAAAMPTAKAPLSTSAVTAIPGSTELNKLILVEADTKKRDELIAEAFRINHDEVGLIPLHQQSLIWGVSKKVRDGATRR